VNSKPNHTGPLSSGATLPETPAHLLRKATGASDGLLAQAASLIKAGQPAPEPPYTSPLPALLATAAEAQFAAQAADDRLQDLKTERDAAQIELHRATSDLHPDLTEDAALEIIEAARKRLDRAELQARRGAAVIGGTTATATKAAVSLGRAAQAAAEAFALRAAVDSTRELLTLLHPSFITRQPAEARQLLLPVVQHLTAVSELGTLARALQSTLASLFISGSPDARRAVLANAAAIVAHLAPPTAETAEDPQPRRRRKE